MQFSYLELKRELDFSEEFVEIIQSILTWMNERSVICAEIQFISCCMTNFTSQFPRLLDEKYKQSLPIYLMISIYHGVQVTIDSTSRQCTTHGNTWQLHPSPPNQHYLLSTEPGTCLLLLILTSLNMVNISIIHYNTIFILKQPKPNHP